MRRWSRSSRRVEIRPRLRNRSITPLMVGDGGPLLGAEIADAIEQRYVIEAVAERSAAIVRADSAAGKLDKHC
ncbi:MAG: hypothetical protein AAGA00_13915, partial [Pseudomonadota bacterium]